MAPLHSAWRRLGARELERSKAGFKSERRRAVHMPIFHPEMHKLRLIRKAAAGLDLEHEDYYSYLAAEHIRGTITPAEKNDLVELLDSIEAKPTDPTWLCYRRRRIYKMAVSCASTAASTFLLGATLLDWYKSIGTAPVVDKQEA